MASSNEPNRDVRRELREEGPPLERREPTARSVETFETPTAAVPPVGPRVRWGGVTSGFIIALGTILLLTALGLAIGITAVGDPRAATPNTVTGLGIGAGIWAALTLLIAYFLGGLVSTTVTDRPDRAGASSMALWSGRWAPCSCSGCSARGSAWASPASLARLGG